MYAVCPAPLQELAALLRKLKAGDHKALIFTQMTRMLDVLEVFLNLHGYTYLRLDGATKPEMRQVGSRASSCSSVTPASPACQLPSWSCTRNAALWLHAASAPCKWQR